MYQPKPIDTSEIKLSDSLISLTEQIASNVHDVWAFGRMNEGWVYGEVKDNKKMITPLLVEYERLSDSEKEYDRNTALETLKMIIKLGYKIDKKE